ncbi:hypothetical protein Moror_4526 [Moniliophthora roreri MCA 2997]|uniref:Uncharacterized protein n=1 Tax=Moniliophthora roreri (strain MCA 2997) TaxID=1381753 RepID=V2YLB0_MONRO|nr:hypothetical protein Moror_4526 [Moniliophthora roreri MCA 2997]
MATRTGQWLLPAATITEFGSGRHGSITVSDNLSATSYIAVQLFEHMQPPTISQILVVIFAVPRQRIHTYLLPNSFYPLRVPETLR